MDLAYQFKFGFLNSLQKKYVEQQIKVWCFSIKCTPTYVTTACIQPFRFGNKNPTLTTHHKTLCFTTHQYNYPQQRLSTYYIYHYFIENENYDF